MRIVLPLAALALLAAGPAARAEVITQSWTQGFLLDPPSGLTAFDVALFDPTLGTLDSVTLSLTGYVTEQNAGIENDTSQFQEGTASVQITFVLENAQIQPTLNLLKPVVTTSETYYLWAHQEVNFASSPIWSDTQTITATPADFMATPDDTSLSIIEDGPRRLIAAPGIAMGSYAASDFSVTYDYTPTSVPEPASMMLLGFGLLALTAGRRFRLI